MMKPSFQPPGFADRKAVLDSLYARLNRRCFVHPDPLEFLYSYNDLRDREIVALIASSLAYGRVAGILRSVAKILEILTPSPYETLTAVSPKDLLWQCGSFTHRFTKADEMASFLAAIGKVVASSGSLQNCAMRGYDGITIIPPLTELVGTLREKAHHRLPSLLPSPEDGSACKRLNLFARWMVRHDDVDPGGWDAMNPAQLLVPVDVHMHRICRDLGFTARSASSLKTAFEITAAFREICPGDPVRYDFALTRYGIRNDQDYEAFLQRMRTR